MQSRYFTDRAENQRAIPVAVSIMNTRNTGMASNRAVGAYPVKCHQNGENKHDHDKIDEAAKDMDQRKKEPRKIDLGNEMGVVNNAVPGPL